MIDICGRQRDIIRRVAQCDYILSTSLHGLVLADSLGIPNHWLRSRRGLLGGDFKFHDYLSVFGIEDPQPLTLDPTDRAESLIRQMDNYQRPGLARIQSDLLESFSDCVGIRGFPFGSTLSAPISSRGTPDTRHDATKQES